LPFVLGGNEKKINDMSNYDGMKGVMKGVMKGG
jgi:hypothetical protein